MNIIAGFLALLVSLPICIFATDLPIEMIEKSDFDTEEKKIKDIAQTMLLSAFITCMMCMLTLVGWGISITFLLLLVPGYFLGLSLYVIKRYKTYTKLQELLTYIPSEPPVQALTFCTQVDEPITIK